MPSVIENTGSLWVVYKPAGWLVHPAKGTDAPNLVDWLVENGAPKGVAPVHRLDLPTSGVILYSDSSEERGKIGRFFVDGAVEKRYVALVHGHTRSKGIIKKPLDDGRRGKPLEALTRYRTRENLGGFSFISVRPATGRKHQIRRHLHSIKRPIVGDERYRAKKFIPVPAFPNRLWLHAERVTLPDGRSFVAPLAEELQAHLEVLRASMRPKAEAETPEAGKPEAEKPEAVAPEAEKPEAVAPEAANADG